MRVTEEWLKEYETMVKKWGKGSPGVIAAPARRVGSVMNKTEQRYANEVLGPLKAGGHISDWKYESIKLRLADRTWYTPDFVLFFPGRISFIEIKGFMRDDAVVKFKVAREQYPEFVFAMVRLVKGEWMDVM